LRHSILVSDLTVFHQKNHRHDVAVGVSWLGNSPVRSGRLGGCRYFTSSTERIRTPLVAVGRPDSPTSIPVFITGTWRRKIKTNLREEDSSRSRSPASLSGATCLSLPEEYNTKRPKRYVGGGDYMEHEDIRMEKEEIKKSSPAGEDNRYNEQSLRSRNRSRHVEDVKRAKVGLSTHGNR